LREVELFFILDGNLRLIVLLLQEGCGNKLADQFIWNKPDNGADRNRKEVKPIMLNAFPPTKMIII